MVNGEMALFWKDAVKKLGFSLDSRIVMKLNRKEILFLKIKLDYSFAYFSGSSSNFFLQSGAQK